MSGCPGWESVNPLCRAGQLLGGAAQSVGSDVFGAIADYFAGVASAAVTWLWNQLNQATSIDLTAPAIKSDLIATGAIAALVTFALFLIQVIASALRQDPGGMGRAVRGMGVAFIGAAFAIASTQVLLVAVDGLCNGVVHFALGTNVRGMGSKLIAATALASIGNPAGLLLLSLVLIAAVVIVWVALMIRKMLIIISAVFAPVAFSGAASDVSRSWVPKWIEFTLALVFSKLILVIIFMIGLSVLNSAGTPSSGAGGDKTTAAVTNLVIGALTLLLAGFAPWIAIKMVHFAGESFHAVHAQAGSAAQGGRVAVAAPQKVAMAGARVGGAKAAFAGGAGARGSRATTKSGGGQPPAPPGRSASSRVLAFASSSSSPSGSSTTTPGTAKSSGGSSATRTATPRGDST